VVELRERDDGRVEVGAALARDGFCVLPGVVPTAMCDRVLAAVRERCGLDVTDPSTWSNVSAEVDQVPVWGHQSQWDIRQLPALHAAWAEAWGTDRLWVSFDSCRFTPPWRRGLPEPLAIHWDHDPRDGAQRFVQGFVALTDTPSRAGGFCCAPSWMNTPERWPAEWPQRPWGPLWTVEPADYELVEIPTTVGDVVMFGSRLPHGTVRNESDLPRAVFYLSYTPAGDAAAARIRVEDFVAGRTAEYWRWKPGHDEPESWPPATLDDLGERLLGRQPW
jgi:Phytanoyl-CoA dioxygenase (PhyH)